MVGSRFVDQTQTRVRAFPGKKKNKVQVTFKGHLLAQPGVGLHEADLCFLYLGGPSPGVPGSDWRIHGAAGET